MVNEFEFAKGPERLQVDELRVHQQRFEEAARLGLRAEPKPGTMFTLHLSNSSASPRTR